MNAKTYATGRVPAIVVGDGVLTQLDDRLSALDAASVLLMVDTAVARLGWAERLASRLAARYAVRTHVLPPGEPTVAAVDGAVERVRELTRPAVVGMGGGSVLDSAKLAAALAANPGSVADYLLCARPWAGKRPAVLIPTTAGTGSEVTRTCVVRDACGRKSWAWDDWLLPELVLLDPQLTRSLPPHLTAATGLDAFVHALEAATGQRRNPISEAHALQALRLIVRHLPRATAEPNDLSARQAMQEAACLAGFAIDGSGTGMGHCIGHALGTLYHLPHGMAVALGLQATLDWSLAGATGNYHAAAESLSLSGDANSLVEQYSVLLARVDFTACLAPFAQLNPDPTRLADCMQIAENRAMADNNARLPEPADFARLAARTVELWHDYNG